MGARLSLDRCRTVLVFSWREKPDHKVLCCGNATDLRIPDGFSLRSLFSASLTTTAISFSTTTQTSQDELPSFRRSKGLVVVTTIVKMWKASQVFGGHANSGVDFRWRYVQIAENFPTRAVGRNERENFSTRLNRKSAVFTDDVHRGIARPDLGQQNELAACSCSRAP